MSRRRMIHEGFWTSRNNLYWTLRQRLLFAGLFSLADDQGRLEGHPALVRGAVFPYDNFTTDDVAEDLKAIETRGCIILYETDGREYIQVVAWWEHQPMQWAKPSEMPAPEGWTDKVRYRHDNDILSCNWTTPQGNAVPDNCDVKGKRIGNRLPKDLPKPLPTPPEIRSSDKSKSKSKSKGKEDTRAAEKTAGAGVADAPPSQPPPKERTHSPKDTTRRALQEHFTSVTGLPPPDAKARDGPALWYAPLRQVAEMTAWDEEAGKELIGAAVVRLDGEGMTVSSPKSILKTITAIFGERRRGVTHPNGTGPPKPDRFSGLRSLAEKNGITPKEIGLDNG